MAGASRQIPTRSHLGDAKPDWRYYVEIWLIHFNVNFGSWQAVVRSD
jgi:hypothetical protein